METPSFHPFDLDYDDIQAQLPGTCFVIDGDLKVLFWSDEAVRIYSYPRAEAMGANFRDLVRFEMKSEDEKSAWAKLISGGTWNGEAIHHDKHGNRFHVLCKTRFVKNEAGEVAGIAAQVRPFAAS